jgi:hypothetical protein
MTVVRMKGWGPGGFAAQTHECHLSEPHIDSFLYDCNSALLGARSEVEFICEWSHHGQ